MAEAWTSKKALREINDFNKELDRIDSIEPFLNKVISESKKKEEQFDRDIENPRLDFLTEAKDSWKSLTIPSLWENEGYPDLDGIVWLSTTIDIPESWKGNNLILNLGPIDDLDKTWLNNKQIGETKAEGFYWALNREYLISKEDFKPGRNTLSVRVVDLGGLGGIYGDREEITIFPQGQQNQTIRLEGDWKFKIEKQKPVIENLNNANRPTVLYNAMIAPLVPYTIKGVIWYQGESNVGRVEQYTKLFPAMIANWRAVWDYDFPFYFAQIAPFTYAGDGTQSARLRNAQRITAEKVPNTGMAVLLDIGSEKTIHPPNKREVGRRLSLLALNNTYGKKLISSGPLPKRLKVKGNTAVVHFKYAKGLTAKDGSLDTFEVAGKDNIFYPAVAKIDGDKVTVYSDKVPEPYTVRYAWKDQATAELFNSKKLPATTFSISVEN